MNDTMVLTNGLTVDEYRERVANALAYLPAEEREEILASVGEHLGEVAVEDVDLVDRLGTPEAYAQELANSAGLGDIGRRRYRPRWDGLRLWLSNHPFARTTAAFVPTLRPAWWVLRGYLAVVAIAVLFDPWPTLLWWPRFWLVPVVGEFGGLMSVLFVAVAVVVSVAIGLRALNRVQRSAVVVVNVAILALSGYAFVDIGNTVDDALVAWPDSDPSRPTSGLRHNGAPIRNIVVFDAKGKPLTDVRLFDQNGEPITVQSAVPRRFIQRSVDEFGTEVKNAYPLVIVDRNGDPVPGKLTTRITTIPALEEPTKQESDRSQKDVETRR